MYVYNYHVGGPILTTCIRTIILREIHASDPGCAPETVTRLYVNYTSTKLGEGQIIYWVCSRDEGTEAQGPIQVFTDGTWPALGTQEGSRPRRGGPSDLPGPMPEHGVQQETER